MRAPAASSFCSVGAGAGWILVTGACGTEGAGAVAAGTAGGVCWLAATGASAFATDAGGGAGAAAGAAAGAGASLTFNSVAARRRSSHGMRNPGSPNTSPSSGMLSSRAWITRDNSSARRIRQEKAGVSEGVLTLSDRSGSV
ncbi:hypothetical protein GCM10009094_31240 [Massilia aurea]